IGMLSQPDPQKQAAQAAIIQKTQAEAEKLHAEAGNAQTKGLLNLAKARTEGSPDAPAEPKGPLELMQQMADINETNATAEHKRASAHSLEHKALVTPLQILGEHAQRSADRFSANVNQIADRGLDHFHRTRDRESKERQAKAQAQRPQQGS